MDKNRIGGMRRRTNWQRTAKSTSIKGAGCKFGGCAPKAVGLTSGGLPLVAESRLRMERSTLTGREKSAKGEVLTKVGKARTVLRKEGKGSASKRRDS
jgi:hypothetical protein